MGKSDNMMMLEHVKEVIKFFPIDNDEQLKFVAVDKNGQPQFADSLEQIGWCAAKEAFVFFIKNPSECVIRHIDEEYRVHEQILLHDNFTICSECASDKIPLQLSLYRGKDLIKSIVINPLTKESFYTTFNTLWNNYITEAVYSRQKRDANNSRTHNLK